MKLLDSRDYEKKEPFRDHSLFIIVCEGGKREIDYFDFFDRLTEKIKVHTYPPIKNKSAPNHLIKNAKIQFDDYDPEEVDELWLVLDTDDHQDLIHDVIKESKEYKNWFVAISNPCFEVWLYFHFEDSISNTPEACQDWKRKVHNLITGGFNSDRHPTLLKDAIKNAESNSEFEGYMPQPGSTSVYLLGQKIYELVEQLLVRYNP